MEGTQAQRPSTHVCQVCGAMADIDNNDGSYHCAAHAIEAMAAIGRRALVVRRHRRTHAEYRDLFR